jgi:predicted RNA-binding Zn-ribbon protein involved in translation (DUF1610 family)
MIPTHARPQTVTQGTIVQCPSCGWKNYLGNAAQSIYLDHRPGMLISAEHGGNGKNYRCPECKHLIFFTRYDSNRQIIAPQGHKFKNVV